MERPKNATGDKKTLQQKILALGLTGTIAFGAIGLSGCGSNEIPNPQKSEVNYEKYMHPHDFSDTPPGFRDWPTGAQCAWQMKYFPEILDGYCGPFRPGEAEEKNKGKTCDEMCQAIIEMEEK